jgi:hypothetical protein
VWKPSGVRWCDREFGTFLITLIVVDDFKLFIDQFTAKEQLESALQELEALKRMIMVSAAVVKDNSTVVTTFEENNITPSVLN